METLQEQFESLKHCCYEYRKRFVELLLKELMDNRYSTVANKLLINKNSLLHEILLIHFDMLNQKFDSIPRIEELYGHFCKQSLELKGLLTEMVENTFYKLDRQKMSFDYEFDIEPIERYLILEEKVPFVFPESIDFLKRERYNRLSDEEFACIKQEFSSFLKEKYNKKLLSVSIVRSYANIKLPKVYDIVFDANDLSQYWECKVIVKYAFNFRILFHTDLWRGHHSHCFIEIIGNIPEIFDELPLNETEVRSYRDIGLCTKFDWQYIRNK